MSRLSELLNPTPNNVSSEGTIASHSGPDRQNAHKRQQSLTSPLEALAIAASSSSMQTTSTVASADHSNSKQFLQHISLQQEDTNISEEPRTSPNSTLSSGLERDAEKTGPEAVISPSEHRVETQETMPITIAVVKTEAKDHAPTNSDGILDVHPQYQAEINEPNKMRDMALPKQEKNGQSGSNAGIPTTGLQSPTVLPTTESRKRAPTKMDKKKGTASVIKKPASKKRKIEVASKDGTPFSQRSATPTSSHASRTPAPKARKQVSITPAQSSPAPAVNEEEGEEDEDDEDDSELFCICRKPDDHTWMIACDGGCEDWFHGRCVNMDQQKGKLIDKYICPNCTAKGDIVTTWKPMCRLESCRDPARASGPNPSKYCSDAHGELYMRQRVLGKGPKESQGPPAKKRKKDNTHDASDALDDANSENVENDKAHLRGGILRPSELKALTSGVENVEEFRGLGNAISSPKSNSNAGTQANDSVPGAEPAVYTSEEMSQLDKVASKKAVIDHKLEVLKDKDVFLSLVRGRAKGILEELKGKDKAAKDVCGFDSRISWSDEEFDNWRVSSVGMEALQSGVLSAPMDDEDSKPDADGDSRMANGEDSHQDQIGRGACLKKRCERHKKWFQLHNQEIAFERDDCRQQMNKLDKEEKGIKQRAMIRKLETSGAAE